MTRRPPLYNAIGEMDWKLGGPDHPHPGLAWQKFFEDVGPFVNADANETERVNGKAAWLSRFDRNVVGEKPLIDQFQRRRKRLIQSLKTAELAPSELLLVSIAPFVTGLGEEHMMENGFHFHHSLGVPYLPATGAKGLARAWAREFKRNELHDLLGPDPGADELHVGRVVFLDALPTEPVELQIHSVTPHHTRWYGGDGGPEQVPADSDAPIPLGLLTVAPLTRFSFVIFARTKADAECVKTIESWLLEATEWAGAGARTAAGFGRFLPENEAASLRFELPAATITTVAPESRYQVGEQVLWEGKEAEVVRVLNGGNYVLREKDSGDEAQDHESAIDPFDS